MILNQPRSTPRPDRKVATLQASYTLTRTALESILHIHGGATPGAFKAIKSYCREAGFEFPKTEKQELKTRFNKDKDLIHEVWSI